jgi:hypothetical protein
LHEEGEGIRPEISKNGKGEECLKAILHLSLLPHPTPLPLGEGFSG